MKKFINAAIGILIGGVLLWLLFKDTNWAAVGEAIRGMHWGWFAATQIPLWGVFFIRVQRWSYIVRASQWVSFKDMFAATQIGFLANFTLPARLGEPIRALVLTRQTGIPFFKSFGMVSVDRLTDLFGLIVFMLVAIAAFQPTGAIVIPAETLGLGKDYTFTPELYRGGAWAIGIVLSIVIVFNAILFLRRNWVIAVSDAVIGVFSKGLAERVRGFINHFVDGLDVFRKPLDFAKANLYSLVVWFCAIAVFYCMLQAFHIDAPWYTPFVMQTILGVFISAPAAPGFVGTFHMPLVIAIALTVPGSSMDVAKAFALVVHIIQLPPIIVFGVYSLMSTNLSLRSLAKEGNEMAEKTD